MRAALMLNHWNKVCQKQNWRIWIICGTGTTECPQSPIPDHSWQFGQERFLLITNLTHCFQCIYFTSLHVSSNPLLIIRRINCINTSSGICHSGRWLSGMTVRTGIPDSHITDWYVPDDVLIKLILLMMSTGLLETCREVKWIHWKKCVKLVINKNYAEMHG